MSASQRRAAVRYLMAAYSVSGRKACKVCRLSRGTWHSQPQGDQQQALKQRIRDIARARARVRYGYKRIHVLLKREGIHVNHKRVYRLYCEEGLRLRPAYQTSKCLLCFATSASQ
ncbi:MAG: transposase [Pseudomonadales bacterium]|nr:transposase [Pseudomonadales bacterium]